MHLEWHAEFALQPGDADDLEAATRAEGRFQAVTDLYARLQLLAQSLRDRFWNTDAKAASKQERRDDKPEELPLTYQWLTRRYCDRPAETRYTEYTAGTLDEYHLLGLATPRLEVSDLQLLPASSFFLYIHFRLDAPYISKDDHAFYVHENPLRKDWVMKVPLVSGPSWKGAFRAALRWKLETVDDNALIVQLLGSAKPTEEGGDAALRRGRLTFFSTFFDRLEVGVINPHARDRSAGTQPIHIEHAPRGAHGAFALLYTPIVPSAADRGLPAWEEVLEEIDVVGRGVHAMLAELGFGAKSGTGMGRAADDIDASYLLVHRWIESAPHLPPAPGDRPPAPEFEAPSREFVDGAGKWIHYESNEQMHAHITGSAARTRYKKERSAYRQWREAHQKWQDWESRVAALRAQSTRQMLRCPLENLSQLRTLGELVAQCQQGGGGG